VNVELPDGTVIEDIPEGTTRAQLAQRLKANGVDVPAEWMQGAAPPQSAGRGLLEGNLGAAETALSMGSGTLGSAVGGIAGLVGAALPGAPGQGARVAQRVQQAMTYEPRTETGKAMTQGVSYPFVKLGEFADYAGGKVAEGTGSPLLGTAANVGVNSVPYLFGMGARPVVAARAAKLRDIASMKQPLNETLARGQELGFKTLPEGVAGQLAQKAGGTDIVKAQLKRSNQEAADAVAREYAGLGPKDPLFRENIEIARDAIEAPYREVASLSPTAESALQEMQTARRKYQLQMDHYRATRNPDVLEKADAFKADENFWTNMMDQEAQRLGRPDLLARFKDARVRSAKNRTVEEALNEGAGSINARKLGALDKRTKGKLLTGKLKDVADWANTFPDTIGDATIRNVGGTHGEAIEMGAAAAAGHVPLALGIPALRGVGRALAKSNMLQPKDFGGRPGLGLRIADIAARNPEALALAPGLGLRPPEE
jgi:hypothetical protein